LLFTLRTFNVEIVLNNCGITIAEDYHTSYCSLDGQYTYYDFIWEISQSEGCSHSNQASVVLIDGSKYHHGDNLLHVMLLLLGRLLYTSFRRCIIPPPMCSHVVTMSVATMAVNQITFSPCLQYMLVMSSVGQAILYCLAQDDPLVKDQHGFQLLTSCPKLLSSTR